MTNALVEHDIYIIPSSSVGIDIVYSPLRRIAFLASGQVSEILSRHIADGSPIPSEAEKLQDYIKTIQAKPMTTPHDSLFESMNRAVFILSHECNLSCSYCYARDNRTKDALDKSKIEVVINHVLSAQNGQVKSFSFIGGGEPTIGWALFVWAVERIKAQTKGQKAEIGLVTNGTLLDKERIAWLKSNEVRLTFSFDILPAIQNQQRKFARNAKGSFETVDYAIKELQSSNTPIRIRSTITSLNVTLMPEMVQHVIDNYPGIRQLHFEPVTDTEHCSADFFENYVTYFFVARTLAKNHKIELSNSIVNAANGAKSAFCKGEFCVTPSGDIVSCHRISSRRDPMFADFRYGSVDDKISISESDLMNARRLMCSNSPQCADCFAKWHCAGGCPNIRSIFSDKQMDMYCVFTRKMIAKEIENKIAVNILDDIAS